MNYQSSILVYSMSLSFLDNNVIYNTSKKNIFGFKNIYCQNSYSNIDMSMIYFINVLNMCNCNINVYTI